MKNTVRILTALLLAVLLCAALIACGHDDTEHVAAGDWLKNDTHHWKACEDGCEGAEVDKAEHVFDNACDTDCNVCGAARTPAEHVYDNACDTACNVCGATREITHTPATALTKGENTHWYACTVCGAKTGEVAHTFDKTVAHADYLKAAATETTKAQYYKSCACGKASATEYFESDKTAATVTDIQDVSKVYDGDPVATPTYQTNSTGVVSIEWYRNGTLLLTVPTDPGTYKVKVTVAETATHAGASAEREITITKAQATLANVAMSPVTIHYGDTYQVNYSTEGDGAVTVMYKVRGADDATYTAIAPTQKGLYTARVTLADGVLYFGTSATVDYEIEARVLTGLSTNVVYSGSNTHEINLSTFGYSNVKLRVTFNDGGNVGATPTGVTVLENDEPTVNYVVDINTCTVNIVAKEVGLSWTAPADLHFDGNEKIPTLALTGIVTGDECTAQIQADGDNVWFDSTFTFSAILLEGADAGNYVLPTNAQSSAYTITIDSMTVGTPSYIADGVYYQKVVIETAGYYYFDFIASTQGVEITFTIFEKGASYTTIPVFTVGDEDKQSAVFELEAGTYYVKSVTDDEPQYDTLTIVMDTHVAADEYGFCDKGCGTYVGEELDTNSWTTVTIPRGQTAYYRFEDGGDVSYNFSYYNSDGTNLTVKCYRTVNAEGDFEELTGFGLLPHEFVTSYDGYYYLIIKHNNALGGSSEKTITFQVEETVN